MVSDFTTAINWWARRGRVSVLRPRKFRMAADIVCTGNAEPFAWRMLGLLAWLEQAAK
jgi:hypothetical protein